MVKLKLKMNEENIYYIKYESYELIHVTFINLFLRVSRFSHSYLFSLYYVM